MEPIGILLVNLLYIMFFILYFGYFYASHKVLALPYFLISIFILIIEFFTLRGDHQIFSFFIIFSILYVLYRVFVDYSEKDRNKAFLKYLPLYTLTPYFLMHSVNQLYASLLILPYIITDSYIQISFIAIISIFIYLYGKHKLTKEYFSGILLCYMVIAIPITINNIKNQIKEISIDTFGKAPQFISIDVNVGSRYRNPHALTISSQKCYFWSFREKKFIENNRLSACIYKGESE